MIQIDYQFEPYVAPQTSPTAISAPTVRMSANDRTGAILNTPATRLLKKFGTRFSLAINRQNKAVRIIPNTGGLYQLPSKFGCVAGLAKAMREVGLKPGVYIIEEFDVKGSEMKAFVVMESK